MEWVDITAADGRLSERLRKRCNEPDGLDSLLLSVRVITIAGHSGVQCVFLGPLQAASATREVAVVVVDARIYRMQTTAPANSDAGKFTAFVNSLRLT